MTFKKDEPYHDQTPGLKDFGRQNVDFLEGEPTSKVPEKLGTGKSENQENVVTNDFLDTFSWKASDKGTPRDKKTVVHLYFIDV